MSAGFLDFPLSLDLDNQVRGVPYQLVTLNSSIKYKEGTKTCRHLAHRGMSLTREVVEYLESEWGMHLLSLQIPITLINDVGLEVLHD
jgi:hypothetical protein